MNDPTPNKEKQALVAYQDLLQSLKSVIIGTVNDQGNPHTSYAPFIIDNQKNFYLLGSELAEHTHHLLKTRKASLLLIDDEAKTAQIFGRRRLTFNCQVTEIKRSDSIWNQMISQLTERFGETITMIASLSDFHLFKLTPTNGRLVLGFGGIYEIEEDNLETLVPVSRKKGK
ncbi:MAG: HugZ family protein [Microcystaceae cyanobacterium]